MASTKGKIATIAVAALLVAAGALWYFESPAWTLKGMRDAAEANNAEALNAYIDYPALREDFKAEVMARMMAEAHKDKTGFGALGMTVGPAIVGRMIDGLVSPAGMRAALIAKRNQEILGGAAAAASALKLPDQPVIVRRGISEFLITTKGKPNGGLMFKRHGLSWKLSGIDLPPDTSSSNGGTTID